MKTETPGLSKRDTLCQVSARLPNAAHCGGPQNRLKQPRVRGRRQAQPRSLDFDCLPRSPQLDLSLHPPEGRFPGAPNDLARIIPPPDNRGGARSRHSPRHLRNHDAAWQRRHGEGVSRAIRSTGARQMYAGLRKMDHRLISWGRMVWTLTGSARAPHRRATDHARRRRHHDHARWRRIGATRINGNSWMSPRGSSTSCGAQARLRHRISERRLTHGDSNFTIEVRSRFDSVGDHRGGIARGARRDGVLLEVRARRQRFIRRAA